MASTYTPIATQTLGSATSTVTFSSIPSTFTDLIAILSVKAGGSSAFDYLTRLNSDSGNNYSITYLTGNGSSASSSRLTNYSAFSQDSNAAVDPNSFGTYIMQFMNYANTNVYKTVLSRNNANTGAYSGVEATVGLWRSTAAINALWFNAGSQTFASGSTFTLYGIQAA